MVGDSTDAVNRMRDAFWAELRQRQYDRITVRSIIRRASVNKNTFYYHYTNMDDLAHDCLDEGLPVEIPTLVLSRLFDLPQASSIAADRPEITEKLSRLSLATGKHSSPILLGFLKESLVHTLTTMLHVDTAQFGFDSTLAVDFLIGGIMGIISRYGSIPREQRVPLPDTLFFARVSKVLPTAMLSILDQEGVALPDEVRMRGGLNRPRDCQTPVHPDHDCQERGEDNPAMSPRG